MDFRIVVYGEKHAALTIEGIGNQAVNLRPALEEIYLTALDIEQELFEKEGARGGFPKWEKLTWEHLRWKVRRGMSPEILRMRDDLYYAMTTYRSRHAFVRFDKTGFVWRPVNPVYKFHMTGYTTRTNKVTKVPARPFVRFTEQDRQAFGREIARHLMRKRGKGPATQVTFT